MPFLIKTEPDSYSIDDLAKEKKQTTFWNGVRNYQARNYMRDEMKLGDKLLFYHSSCDPPAIVGIATVARESYPDHTQFDPQSDYYDEKATKDAPRWFMVDVQLERKFATPLTLDALRKVPALKKMELLKQGSRLSVQPVTQAEYDAVLKLAGK